jgi:hypothetical protein
MLIALLSCGSRQKTVESTSNTRITKEVSEIYRDTTFFAPKQSTQLNISLRQLCDTYKVNQLQSVSKEKPKVNTPDYSSSNGSAFIDANLMGDFLNLNAGCDSIAIAAKIKERLVRELKETEDSVKEDKKRGVSTFRLIYTSAGTLALGLIVGIILTKFRII